MLEQQLLEQLATHFGGLESTITLAVRTSTHEKQQELLELLGDVASCSPRLSVHVLPQTSDTVHFEVLKDGGPTGIHFKAVPGGHEFTSLVLAILHADNKGRWPDDSLKNRVRSLRGPVVLRTYLSLSCTNCPDVVQALNQMALLHRDFVHTAIDGELVPQEIERLGIQGVPAVFAGDKLVHVGKADFGELLETLENHFGSAAGSDTAGESTSATQAAEPYDVVVLGSGPAGTAAAIYSARKGLRTAVVAQRVGGQVNDTLGIENLVSVPHTEGPKLAADLRAHLAAWNIELYEHRRIDSVTDGEYKTVHLAGGETLRGSQLIVATGAKWRELGVAGEKEHIGKGVAFCPHCDGPFFKGRRVAVVGGGNSGVEAAIDLAGICSTVTLLEFADELKADRVLVEKLKSLPNVTIHTHARTTEVAGTGSAVTGIRWQDRHTEVETLTELDGIFVQIGLVPNSAMVKDLVETNRMGEIVVDPHNRSSVQGIYAAGDVSSVPYKQIVIAMGEGAKAALTAFEDRMRS